MAAFLSGEAMEDISSDPQSSVSNKSNDDCEDVNMILTGVVKRRKTIPTKCIEVNKQIFAHELHRLESANIDTEEYHEKEKFKEIIQELKKLKLFQFSLDDLNEAEEKLKNGYKKIKEINLYLQERKKTEN